MLKISLVSAVAPKTVYKWFGYFVSQKKTQFVRLNEELLDDQFDTRQPILSRSERVENLSYVFLCPTKSRNSVDFIGIA